MSELVKYYVLTEEPVLSGISTVITGNYKVCPLYKKNRPTKWGYVETYTSPMLNLEDDIDDPVENISEDYEGMYGKIKVFAKIYYEYTEYFYHYYSREGYEYFFLKVMFNSKSTMDKYELPTSLIGTELTKVQYLNAINSEAMGNPYIPEEEDKPVEEAPEDGFAYVRKNKTWVRLVDEETDAAELIDHNDSESGESGEEEIPETK